MVWKIDRWGGSLTHLVTSLAELDAYGVAFVSLRDNLDLSTPSGRLMMLGEYENSIMCPKEPDTVSAAIPLPVRITRLPTLLAEKEYRLETSNANVLKTYCEKRCDFVRESAKRLVGGSFENCAFFAGSHHLLG